MNNDVKILRELAAQYAELAGQPIQEERRKLWAAQNSLKKTRPLIIVQPWGLWIEWCREVFADANMQCKDPFFRGHERQLRISIFSAQVGDDRISEPWINQGASLVVNPDGPWGVETEVVSSGVDGGAVKQIAPLDDWGKMDRLVAPRHQIDEEETARNVEQMQEAVGDILEVNVNRTPILGYAAKGSIAETLCELRGMEEAMMDMLEHPDELHKLAAFMRDATLANHDQAEAAGDWSLTSGFNQAMAYAEELARPKANVFGHTRSEIWGWAQAQELTMVSPQMHEEFFLQYQIPIMEKFGLMAYGCCGDLTRKIDMLRQIQNLRMISVAPVADVARCAEQIGPDYVISYRPNPTDMVCCGFDEAKIRRILSKDMDALRANDCRFHINLKDVYTVEGDPCRISRWTKIVREVMAERF